MNILITGASRGIGFELVKKFAGQPDNHIIAVSRNREGLKRLEREYLEANNGSKLVTCPFDIEKGDYHDLLNNTILPRYDRIDILVNNAGLLVFKPFDELTDEDFDRMFNVNVKGVFRMIRMLYPYFSEGSHIVNVSSMGGYQGSAKFPGLSLYSAGKGAVAILTECLAEEFKERKISVNCLAIGAVQTEMLSEAFPGYKAPLTPVEMANFMFDFAMSGHRFFNGKILPVSVSTP